MGAWITITMSGGTSIERACEDAHRVANRLGISAEFDFNDVRCVATPQGSAELLATRQQAEQRRKPMVANERKFASSDPRIKPATEEPPVDPLLIEARRIIAADYSQREHEGPSERCLDGSCDESFVMRTTVTALRRGIELAKEQSS